MVQRKTLKSQINQTLDGLDLLQKIYKDFGCRLGFGDPCRTQNRKEGGKKKKTGVI